MNPNIYVGKSYIAGDGDNTLSLIDIQHRFKENAFWGDTYYFNQNVGVIVLIPASISKWHSDLNKENSDINVTNWYSSSYDNYRLEIMFSKSYVESTTYANLSLLRILFVDSELTLSLATKKNININIGDIIQYYDIDRGSWIIETVNKKEMLTTADSFLPATKHFKTTIGTISKPNLLTVEYIPSSSLRSEALIFTIDLKTGSENNNYIE